MKISLNALKKYVDIPAEVSTDELVKLIGSRLVEIEGTEDWSKKYENIYIVKVLSAEPIEGTHLHLCQIDAGKDPVQVVCGAPNVHANMYAVWIAPGAIVPCTYGTDEPFEISSRKLRGFESNGMLSAADELGLGEDHDGIISIDPEMIGADGQKITPGCSFADAFGLNDLILDIENKSLTHRPDTFGLIGFAREISGILGLKFNEPEVTDYTKAFSAENKVEVEIKDAVLCPRYTCAVIDFEDAPHSEYFTLSDVFLIKAGMRPISPIVDVTNIVMLETGQPLHAFDYDKFVSVGGAKDPKIIVRAAKEGEELELLDGKTIKCNPSDILITSNDKPVALAGAMGGANTTIDASTKHIILESATFSLYNLRKTQMAHGIFSEAITRFTKGQPAALCGSVLDYATAMLGTTATTKSDAYPNPMSVINVNVTAGNINGLLGSKYTNDQIVSTLENVGFAVEEKDNNFTVKAPLWRTDIHIKEDVIEEVGRLQGFDNIPQDYPLRPFVGAAQPDLLVLKNQLREILSDKLDSHEALTYSFVSKALQTNAGEDAEKSYKIVNSISPELQCFRQSITPSLLEKVRDNLKAGYADFSLYELNQTTSKDAGVDEDGVPVMETHLSFVMVGDYYAAKAHLVAMLKELHLEFTPTKVESASYFEPLHSANIEVAGIQVGMVGEIKNAVLKRFKLDQTVSAFEIHLEKLLPLIPAVAAKNLQISKFPSVSRDVTLKALENLAFEKIENCIKESLAKTGLYYKITPVSIYQAEGSETKNISFHMTFESPEKTLKAEEISAIMEQVTKEITTQLGVELV